MDWRRTSAHPICNLRYRKCNVNLCTRDQDMTVSGLPALSVVFLALIFPYELHSSLSNSILLARPEVERRRGVATFVLSLRSKALSNILAHIVVS
ncbi:hypothetical protein RRG08_040784 [Elysia crispata]|uniref:Uncharacterized protein n=1 Tax=Elysia crispata TaxID=231223 RepID=A0AAE1BDR6_9GAST|nr:hypothetical protein RRG08_040784 [Elysia crispata]